MRRRLKRRLRIAVACLACLAAGALADARLRRVQSPAASGGAVSDAASGPEAALDRVIPAIDLEAVPFAEAVERVRRLTGAPIVMESKALEASPIDPHGAVTYRARNATLAQVLAGLCNAANANLGAGQSSVWFAPMDGAIVVSTRNEVESRSMSVRIYDVRGLVRELASDPWDDETGLPVPDSAVSSNLLHRSGTLLESVMQLVEATVDADSWRDSGGTVGSIRELAGRLVITQTWENHRRIADVLARFRAPAPRGAPPPGPDLMLWDEALNRYVSVQSTEGESALGRRLPEVRLDAVPLDNAVSTLARTSHANIAANWQAIASAGTNPHAPVTLHLHDVTLADALRALFTAAGIDKVRFDPDGAYVRLTSRDDAVRPVRTRTYDVRDCLRAVVGPPPAGPGRREWGKERDFFVASLQRCIQESVDPDSWKDAGGFVGVIREWNGQLIVTQTWENQQKVADLLAALRTDPDRLRAALTTQPAPATAPAPPPGGDRNGPNEQDRRDR